MSVYQKDLSRIFKTLLLKYETQIVFNKNIDRKLERFGVIEVTILEHLKIHDSVTFGDLIKIVPLRRGKLLGILKRLTDVGYIIKEKNETDKRSSYIKLNDKGYKVLERYGSEEDEFLDFVLADMTINEEKTIIKFLSKINQTKYMK